MKSKEEKYNAEIINLLIKLAEIEDNEQIKLLKEILLEVENLDNSSDFINKIIK